MLKHRLIGVLIVADGQVVQSIQFKHTNIIHSDPVEAVNMFNDWAVDEIVILNVSRDKGTKKEFLSIIKKISISNFVPLSVGGWIENIDDVKEFIHNGADKVVLNTQAFKNPLFISEVAKLYGSQCVVVSIDYKIIENRRRVVIDRGRVVTDMELVEWSKKVEKMGGGELLVNCIDADGNRKGYELEGIKDVVENVNIPVIAFGGVYKWSDLVDGIKIAKADAVAVANMLHYIEHSARKAKRYLLKENLNFRKL